ncbi:MAG: alpha/beta hydrolase [Herbaspirillum sp.]
MTTALLETIQIETGANPTAAVIWMHGLGADATDFVPFADELDLHGCPPIRFVFPHAPSIPVTVNNGYVMRAWYDIFGADIVQREDETGLRSSQTAIEALIAREVARGIATEHIVLAGFSQGCALTLQTGLRHPKKLAGLLCLSGYVPLQSQVTTERHPANQATPIFLAHGTHDPVIPIQRAQASRDFLLALGYNVDWHSYQMQHAVCPQEIDDIGSWLRQHLV